MNTTTTDQLEELLGWIDYHIQGGSIRQAKDEADKLAWLLAFILDKGESNDDATNSPL